MPPPPPPPSLEMADMLKPRNHAVATFRTFSSIGPSEGMHLFVYDELCPPLRAVRGMLTETSLFYQRGANLRPYRDFPFTRRLEYAGSHEDGPLFAPVEGTPQAIADNEHMRELAAGLGRQRPHAKRSSDCRRRARQRLLGAGCSSRGAVD